MGVGGKEKKQAKDQCRLRKCLLDVALGTHLWGREEGIGICLGRCVGNLNWGWRRCLWSPRGLPGCAVGRVLSVVGLVPDGHCLPLPVTFHRLSGTFLTLFLERALRLIPSPHRPSTPKAPSAKNAIWKPGSQKSRAVNQTSEPAGPVWEEREKGRVLGHGVGSGCGQGPGVLIPGQGSLCASASLLLNVVQLALVSLWGSFRGSSDAWPQSKRNRREEIPLSVIQEGGAAFMALLGPWWLRRCTQCTIFHLPACAEFNPRGLSLSSSSASTGYIIFFFKLFFKCITISFWCGPFEKSLLNFLQYSFCFLCWCSGHETCGILTPWPGNRTCSPSLEDDVLTTGPPWKSLAADFRQLTSPIWADFLINRMEITLVPS